MSIPWTAAACGRASGDSSSSCAAAREARSASVTPAVARANTRFENRCMGGLGRLEYATSADRWIRYPWDNETQLRLARRDHRHDVPAVAAVAPEITIEREDHALHLELGHAHETGIG